VFPIGTEERAIRAGGSGRLEVLTGVCRNLFVKPECATPPEPILPVETGELIVKKIANKEKVKPGETIERTLEFTASGGKIDGPVHFTDRVPAGLEIENI
jgi:uncharacterized repeat protein (TIGR01451 family)